MEAERDDNWATDKVDQSSRPCEDWQHVQRLREGDAEAGHVFVQQYYPGVYHYLLYLTGRPELAEDLTQETFLQAWRRLDTFAGRAPLRLWLHRIAHREFLQAVRRPRPVVPLEEVAEVEAPRRAEWAEGMVLEEAIRRLPPDQQQVVILRYLQGYDCQEIGEIIRAPVGTVKYWLSLARTQLQGELGEGDLSYLNEVAAPMRQWSWLPLDQMHALEMRLGLGRSVPLSAGADHRRPTTEETMERREFLRQAGVGAAGLMLSETEKEIVDSRLTQKVTCAFKGTALSDVCDQLSSDTSIRVTAGPSVADEKVTLFCEKLPLREVIRQLSRPFGYTWLRSGTPGQYRYELVQDLRSQLLEEELRNRDRNAALLAFEREMDRFRPYLDLSPDEALAKAKISPPAERKLLETLAGVGWGPIQMYFRLSPQQMTSLRSGVSLIFSETPEKPDEYPLPQDLTRGVLQCNRGWRVTKQADGAVTAAYAGEADTPGPQSVPPGPGGYERLTALPEVRALMCLTLTQSELGQFALGGGSGFITPAGKHFTGSRTIQGGQGGAPYVVGASPSMVPSASALGAADARLARDPALRLRVSVQPQPSCHPPTPSEPVGTASLRAPVAEPKVTVADVLEAIHQATRMPIVADHYTRLFKPEAVSVSNQPLFEALNRVSEPMRLRWNKDGDWLQFRSASYYNDRPKEVPNRLLARWAAARRRQGLLSLDDLVEISQLTDAQLDGAEMAEGATECWGLKEWFLVRNNDLRWDVRFLAAFTPAQRQEMMSAAGLPFTKMSLAQQQRFLPRALQNDDTPLQSPEELAGATLRVDYTQPGWYQWFKAGEMRSARWVVGVAKGRRVLMPPVRERTSEAALRTARRLFPPVTEAMIQAWRPYRPDVTAEKLLPQPEQIAPTELDLVIVYIPSLSTAHSIRWVRTNQNCQQK